MAQIFHFFNVKSSNRSLILNAINTEKGIKDWWTIGTKLENNVFHFTFNGSYTKSFKIINTDENDTVEWECIAGHDDWIGTRIAFKLKAKPDSTDISFRHYNWETESDHFGDCNYHWGLFMKSLKTLIETGTGHPHIF